MKTLHCRDAGFDCEGIIRAGTEEEVMTQAAKHALEVHDVKVTPSRLSKSVGKLKMNNYLFAY